MKPGDLVRLKELPPFWDKAGFEIGDLAIFVAVDWDESTGNAPIKDKSGKMFTGRGYFFFPSRPDPWPWHWNREQLGVLCLYENFEVL